MHKTNFENSKLRFGVSRSFLCFLPLGVAATLVLSGEFLGISVVADLDCIKDFSASKDTVCS
jgi:hypothetical protein